MVCALCFPLRLPPLMTAFTAARRLTYFLPIALAFLVCVSPGQGLDNGLARKPPMGWMSWQRFACEIDCHTYPADCISEQLYRDMADHLVADGYADLGYEYVNIDDCWPEKTRDPDTQQLVADRARFPSGIAALANYTHAKGLKLGIYGDIGTLTCGGYPGFADPTGGLTNFFMVDAETFSEWGIDSLKVDGCYADPSTFWWLYPRLGSAINMSASLAGRPMLYACSWPAYQIDDAVAPDYKAIAQSCNLWRNYDDIMDSWQSVLSIVDFYAKHQDVFTAINGPGAWFDPDMLIIGNFGLSLEQSRAQMALWSIWSAPLLMSNDLRSIKREHREILQNRHVIEVDQDELGIMGRRVFNASSTEIWSKAMTPVIQVGSAEAHSFAVVYFNRRTLGAPVYMSQTLSAIITDTAFAPLYNVYDLFDDGKLLAKLQPSDALELKVNNSGVRMVKLVPQTQQGGFL